MYCIFYRTNDVFIAEEICTENNIECKVVPTPVQDKAYCGVCLRISSYEETIKIALDGMEYKLIY